MRAVEELGLEGEDREAFLALQRRFFLSTSKGRRDAHRLQGELRAQLMAAEPDRAEVDRLQGELAAAHAALERAFVENLLDTRELLDGEAEQRYMRWMARMHRQGEPRGPGERGMDREGFRRRMEERRRR